MPNTIQQGIAAGMAYAQLWKVTQEGYFAGTASDPESLSTDTVYSPYVIKDPEGFEFSLPSRNAVEWVAGDRYQGQMPFGIASIGDATFSRTMLDAVLNALITGSSVDATTNTFFAIFAPNVAAVELPLLGMLYSQRFQSRATGTKGIDYWLNLMFPRLTLSVASVGAQTQQGNPYTYNAKPTLGDKLPNGTAFSSLGIDVEDDEDLFLYFITQKPMTLVNYVADGVETTFNTVYQPISTTVTDAASPNWFATQGVQEALSSIVIASGLATMGGAQDANDNNVLMHLTNKFDAVT